MSRTVRSGRVRRGLARTRRVMAFAVGLSLPVMLTQAAVAAPRPPRAAAPPPVSHDHPVAGHTVVGKVPGRPSVDTRALTAPPVVSLPPAASVDVAVPAPATIPALPAADRVPPLTQAGRLPVWVGSPTRAARPDASAGAPARVRVQTLGAAAAQHAGVSGLLLRVSRLDGAAGPGRVALRIDYSGFRDAFGGDWASRLVLRRLPACALTTPAAPGCRGTTIPATNSLAAGQLDAVVDAGTAAGPQVVALTAGASGPSGTYQATSLSPSASWQVGAQSGDFTWSYPLRVPPVPGGQVPHLSLSYDSQSVDGRTASTNNQPSAVGEGWDLWPGYVERSYRGCADDGHAGVGDLCWGTDNATLMLNGSATPLVRDTATGTWKLKNDDGSSVRRVTGAANGDNDGESWVLTTTDGTQYHFGMNHLPGWATGMPVTNSTWTVPVFGNNAGEPCFTATFATAACAQAWRWNLDYVVDPHGNTISYYYSPETNFYDKNLGSAGVAYTRGGTLAKAVYGTTAATNYATAPAQVVFTTADRCVTAPCTLTSNATAGTANANWPDVPADQYCNTATCTNKFSPTFWSQKRLASISTQIWTGTGYATVDTWTLSQEFPDPNDGSSAALWLRSITHTGTATGTNIAGDPVTLAAVRFDGLTGQNRVDLTAGWPQMNKYRISDITTETGATIAIQYAPTDCDTATLPTQATQDSNTHRCFPQWWSPPLGDPVFDWFHHYVVAQVTEDDGIPGEPVNATSYDYLGGGAWHYTDDDESTPTGKRTWSQWRGYARVQVRHGAGIDEPQSLTEYRYYRGMNGDHQPGGGTAAATVTDSQGVVHTDTAGQDGFVLEKRTFDGVGGAEVSGQINTPARTVTATHTTDQGLTVTAAMVHTATARGRVTLAAGGTRTTETDYTYDTFGNVTQVDDHGDTSTPTDDQCTRTRYAANTTAGLVSYAKEAATVAVACSNPNPVYPDDAVLDLRTSYDGQPWGTPPTKGDVTAVQQAVSYTGSTPNLQTVATTSYDSFGRATSVTDPMSRATTTVYTQTNGLTTQTAVTNPAGFTTTTTLAPEWGLPIATVDPNTRRIDEAYDPLGRLTDVWLPAHPKASWPQGNLHYDYHVTAAPPSSVATTALGPNGIATTSYVLYDGLLRQRQTQSPATGTTGRVVTDTLYDSRGLVVRQTNPYYNISPPGGTLLATDLNNIPGQTETVYDGAERATASIFRAFGAEQWRTTTSYGGDRTSVTPPAGGTATTTLTDVRDRPVELRQYHGGTPGGDNPATFDRTTYTYATTGQLATLTDPAGDTWTHTYDLRGRELSSVDPDTGTTTNTYDDDGELTSTTDARGQTLAYTYDALSRKTGEYDGSTTGTQLASWTYDTLLKGFPTASTRFVDGNAYTTAVLGYTTDELPSGNTVTIPVSEGALAGVYRYRYVRYADDSIESVGLPLQAEPDGPETLTYQVDDLGHQIALTSGFGDYVTGAVYTELGNLAQIDLATAPGSFLQYAYDAPTNRLTETSLLPGNQPTTTDAHYTYDPAGNLTSITNSPQAGPTDTQCFGYDYLRRLTQAFTPATAGCASAPSTTGLGGPAPYWQTYGYDQSSDRTTLTSHATTTGGQDTSSVYTYPATGQPHPHALSTVTTTGPAGTTVDSYGYDPSGRTTTRGLATGTQTLGYDAEGHLTTLTAAGHTTTYLYDADGTRLLTRDATGTTLYLPYGVQLHADTTGTTSVLRQYTFAGQTIATRVGTGFDSTLDYLAADPHGTATQTLDATTLTASTRYFDPFGNPRGTPPPSWPDDHGFLNGVTDPSGLTRLGARDYDPTLGRFTTVDSFLDTADPTSLNGYGYADANPATNTDPTGQLCNNGPDGQSCYDPNRGTTTPLGGKQSGGSSGGGGSGGGSSVTYANGTRLDDDGTQAELDNLPYRGKKGVGFLAAELDLGIPRWEQINTIRPGTYLNEEQELDYLFAACGERDHPCGDDFLKVVMSARNKLLLEEGYGLGNDTPVIGHGVGGGRGSSVRFGPHDSGPLPNEIAETFRGGSYTQTVLDRDVTLYRVYGGKAGKLGRYWTRVKPSGPLQAQLDSALNPEWGNTATRLAEIRVPAGTTIYEGTSAPQRIPGGGMLPGGGSQVYIVHVDESWLVE